MPSYTTDSSPSSASDRIGKLKQAVQLAAPGVCIDRAVLWTEYYKANPNGSKPPIIKMAEALSHVLDNKNINIYPHELLVGNFSSKRVGGNIYPELHGVTVLEDLFKFSKRETSPLQISGQEKRRLLGVAGYWMFRFLGFKAYKSLPKKLSFISDQLNARFYLLNELGGIGHLAPDYGKLIRLGLNGYRDEINQLQAKTAEGSEAWNTYQGMKIIAKGMSRFGMRYAKLAREMAKEEADPARKQELMDISRVCSRVPTKGAKTLRQALQSILLLHIGVTLEGLDNGICPGRMDQYLYPFYEADIAAGRLTREGAKELLAAFCIKLCEVIPVFGRRITRFHGGMFNGQVVTVGGVDAEGQDACNEVSMILLELMDELRMRQPNFHARLHPDAPPEFTSKVFELLAKGANTPALYNDPAVEAALRRVGYSEEDARNYTGIGCVEPVCQGKSLSSTDAALVNVPLLLELALNQGRRFGSRKRLGAKTPAPEDMRSMDDVVGAFETQLAHLVERLIEDLRAVEKANMEHHPTPLTSMLLEGCVESGTCSTAGGAAYNFSGVQCVGPVDTGDALYAIDKTVFIDKKCTMGELVSLLRSDLEDGDWLAHLLALDKFGNDIEEVDRWTRYVIENFEASFSGHGNTRGGAYTTGLYSVTAHQYYGEITGAMAHGKKRGQPLASGIAPVNGMDRHGPTALLNSLNRLDFTRFANGINLNLKFDFHCLRGAAGPAALESLMKTYFRRGGMQAQINVLDPQVLIEARDNPGLHPNLVVRVSGYSAYFNDLTPEMKEEIIQRTNQLV